MLQNMFNAPFEYYNKFENNIHLISLELQLPQFYLQGKKYISGHSRVIISWRTPAKRRGVDKHHGSITFVENIVDGSIKSVDRD